MAERMRMRDYLTLPETELVRSIEIFEKLEDAICNYENVAALYGKDSKDARNAV